MKIFESAKKNLRIQKYSDTCGAGLSNHDGNGNENVKRNKKETGLISQSTLLFISLPLQREIPSRVDLWRT